MYYLLLRCLSSQADQIKSVQFFKQAQLAYYSTESYNILFSLSRSKDMGLCMSRDRSKNHDKPSFDRAENVGIQIIKNNETQLLFHHSPLQACPFLSNKFSQSASHPEQINLKFMIASAQIDPLKNQAYITIINEKEINLYFVLGGEEAVSKTGLTMEIDKIKYVEKINRKQPTSKDGERILVVPTLMNREPIFLIMQPCLKDGQSMFLVSRYLFSPTDKNYHLKSQSLQWSNLAFELQDIYGADNLFNYNTGQRCSVCLSSPANVILTPCRHMCMCSDCSTKFQKSSNRCPICRAQFRAIINYN